MLTVVIGNLNFDQVYSDYFFLFSFFVNKVYIILLIIYSIRPINSYRDILGESLNPTLLF